MNPKQGFIIITIIAFFLCVGFILVVAHVITQVEYVVVSLPIFAIAILIQQRVLKKDPDNFYSRLILGKSSTSPSPLDTEKHKEGDSRNSSTMPS